jgi:hypothetical protein
MLMVCDQCCSYGCTVRLVHGGSHTMNKSSNKQVAPGKGQRNKSAPRSAKNRPNRGRAQNPGLYRGPGRSVPKPQGGSEPIVGVAAAYASGQRTRAPSMKNGKDWVRIVHRELLGSVTGSIAFVISNTIALNPGLVGSFPWLSSQAQSWERYRFNRLRFCYYTRTGSNVPGSVQMIPDYDAADAAPLSEQIASTYEDVAEDAPWKDICCECRPDALHALGPTKFIRTGALAANLDIKTYDAGNFFLATIDGTAVNWGKLWVEYDVTLFTPQLPPSGGGAIVAQAITSSSPNSAAMLASQVPVSNSNLIVSVTLEVMTFLVAGQFLVVYNVQASTSAAQAAPPAIAAGGTILYSQTSGNTTVSMTQELQIEATVGTTLTFNNTLTGGTAAVLFVVQLPALLGTA